MDDLISRKALLDIVGKIPLSWEYGQAISDVYDIIKAMPTLTLDDLRPKGCWNIVEFDDVSRRITIECSECGMVEELTLMAYGFGHNFCHICGADMRRSANSANLEEDGTEPYGIEDIGVGENPGLSGVEGSLGDGEDGE